MQEEQLYDWTRGMRYCAEGITLRISSGRYASAHERCTYAQDNTSRGHRDRLSMHRIAWHVDPVHGLQRPTRRKTKLTLVHGTEEWRRGRKNEARQEDALGYQNEGCAYEAPRARRTPTQIRTQKSQHIAQYFCVVLCGTDKSDCLG